MEGPFCLIWYFGQKLTSQSLHQWPFYILMDSPCSMVYARRLSLADMMEILVGCHCVDLINHKGDYGLYLQQIMTHLVVSYAMLSFNI